MNTLALSVGLLFLLSFFAPTSLSAQPLQRGYRLEEILQTEDCNDPQPNEKLIWEKGPQGEERIKSRWYYDEEGVPGLLTLYDYEGNSVTETVYGNLTGNCHDDLIVGPDGIPVDNDIESYTTLYLFSNKGLLMTRAEQNGKTMHITYHSGSDQVSEIVMMKDDTLVSCRSFEKGLHTPTFESFSATMYYLGRELARSSGRHMVRLLSDLYTLLDIEDTIGDLSQNPLIGEGIITMSGLNLEDHSCGVVGQGEVNDKVRITFINGILNTEKKLLETAGVISKLHGNTNIHYTHSSTDGWSWDMIGSVLSKVGIISFQARYLAEDWKALIDEMGGTYEGGMIIHYAHSLGAADTWGALQLLSPEERRMIKVYTFGAPQIIEKDGLIDAINYISSQDGVGLIGILTGSDNYISLDPFPSTRWVIPGCDHLIQQPTYFNQLTTLGLQFVEEYGPIKSPTRKKEAA